MLHIGAALDGGAGVGGEDPGAVEGHKAQTQLRGREGQLEESVGRVLAGPDLAHIGSGGRRRAHGLALDSAARAVSDEVGLELGVVVALGMRVTVEEELDAAVLHDIVPLSHHGGRHVVGRRVVRVHDLPRGGGRLAVALKLRQRVVLPGLQLRQTRVEQVCVPAGAQLVATSRVVAVGRAAVLGLVPVALTADLRAAMDCGRVGVHVEDVDRHPGFAQRLDVVARRHLPPVVVRTGVVALARELLVQLLQQVGLAGALDERIVGRAADEGRAAVVVVAHDVDPLERQQRVVHVLALERVCKAVTHVLRAKAVPVEVVSVIKQARACQAIVYQAQGCGCQRTRGR